jgi:short-subunit dehydrogenase
LSAQKPNSLITVVQARATPLQQRHRGIVIGASGGIGSALALRLAREGFDLALVGRNKATLSKLSKELVQIHPRIISYTYIHDVTDHKAVPSLLKKIVAELGGLDLVVYVSGVNLPPGLNQYDFAGDREMVEVNLIGAMAWLDPIAAMFQSAKAGQIVAISSVAGDRGGSVIQATMPRKPV